MVDLARVAAFRAVVLWILGRAHATDGKPAYGPRKAHHGLLFGAVSILAFALQPLTLLGAVVGLVWALWLGIVLWQAAEPLT
jgi:hypothetical protein